MDTPGVSKCVELKADVIHNTFRRLIILLVFVSQCSLFYGTIRERVLYYTSVDQHGDTLTLSGKVSVPDNPSGIILLPHFTIASNNEVPSTSTIAESKYLRKDYVLIMPDYIGYGVTRDRVHPYLRGDLTARNCVDMFFASWPLLDSMHVALPKDTISIVGFSQGGATALWILKLLEQEYSDRVCVKHCCAGSGPYDVAATYDYSIQHNKVGMPMIVPMLVMGTSEAYDLDLQRKQFFTAGMDKHYDDYVTSKKHSFTLLYFLMPSHKVDSWLSTYGADKRNPETGKLYQALVSSSLVHYPLDSLAPGQDTLCLSWRPKASVYVFHSYNDRIVPFVNAEHLQRCWQRMDNVTFEFGHYGSHLRSNKTFFPLVKKRLRQ